MRRCAHMLKAHCPILFWNSKNAVFPVPENFQAEFVSQFKQTNRHNNCSELFFTRRMNSKLASHLQVGQNKIYIYYFLIYDFIS